MKNLSNTAKYLTSFVFFNVMNYVLIDSAPERVENRFLSIGFAVVIVVILYVQALIQAQIYCEENGKQIIKDIRYHGHSAAFIIINTVCAIVLTLIVIVT